MILAGTLALILLLSIHALGNWRSGLFSIVIIAALQDPLRKLSPGAPGWMVLATAPVLAALILGSQSSVRGWFSEFRRSQGRVAQWLTLLVAMSLPSALISATYGTNSWMLTALGAFSYSLIFTAVIAGFHYPRGTSDIHRLLAVYCIVHGVMLSGGILEYLGWYPDWTVLGDEALGYNWVRHEIGYVVEIICGFYRSGDVLGWHASAVAMLSLVLAVASGGSRRWFWLGMSGWAVVALMLCGRRKMVFMLPLFGVVMIGLFWRAGRAARAWSLAGLLMLPLASVWLVRDWLGDDSAQIRYYTESGDQTLDSVQTHGFSALLQTYRQSGFFGEGLGVATPGSRQIQAARPRVWQESGPSRVLVELGVPGALAFLGVLSAIAAGMWRTTLRQLRSNTRPGLYAAGLMAFFAANVGSLTVSGQILADPFISAFLGLQLGIVLSMSRPAFASSPAPTRPVGWAPVLHTTPRVTADVAATMPTTRNLDPTFRSLPEPPAPDPQLELFGVVANQAGEPAPDARIDFDLESAPAPEPDPAQLDLFIAEGAQAPDADAVDEYPWH